MMSKFLAIFSAIDSDTFIIPRVEADTNAIENALRYLFAIIGALSVLMVIISGLRYIISTGDPQKTATAKNAIIYAVIGLVVSLSAFMLVGFILNAIQGNIALAGTMAMWR